MIEPLRLALGTLTGLPTKPPAAVDRGIGSWAMTLAPLIGALLAIVAGAFMWLLQRGSPSPLLVAALTIGLLAVLTQAIHLDGLADTADGLGSGKRAAAALAIMRKSDVGPFGVATLTLVLLVQVAALAQHVGEGNGTLAVALALVVSRSLLPLICSQGIPAARPEGLGHLVAGSVSRVQLLAAGGACVTLMAFVLAILGTGTDLGRVSLLALVDAAVALLAGAAYCRWCVRRLGGVTGDVMGACVEVTFTVALVVLTLL